MTVASRIHRIADAVFSAAFLSVPPEGDGIEVEKPSGTALVLRSTSEASAAHLFVSDSNDAQDETNLIADVELLVDPFQMLPDRTLAHAQPVGDALATRSLEQEHCNFPLSRRQMQGARHFGPGLR
jgi:hypothetical protein